MERELVGQGGEHTVYKANTKKEVVIKKPRPLTHLSVKYLWGGAEKIKQEIEEAQLLVENTVVTIPNTRVWSMHNSYLVTQEMIEEDNSVNIGEQLQEYGPHSLYTLYQLSPENFASQNGNIYWLDPMKGLLSRFLESSHLLSVEQYKQMKLSVKKKLGR